MLKKINKILIFSIFIFLLSFSIIFSKENNVVENSEIKTVGPKSAPNIKGPTVAAPTKIEIDEIKRKAGHQEFIIEDEKEKGIFQNILDWLSSWF